MGTENRVGMDTAGEHLVARLPRAQRGDTVGEALGRLRATRYDAADTVYIVDGAGRLEGLIPLTDLLAVDGYRKLGSLMQPPPPHVRPSTEPEQVASVALRHGITSVPVVDAAGALLGVVPARAILELLRRGHREDQHPPGSTARENRPARGATAEPPVRRLRDRLPWLLVAWLGSTLAAFMVARLGC